MNKSLEVGQRYKHYTGELYEITSIITNSRYPEISLTNIRTNVTVSSTFYELMGEIANNIPKYERVFKIDEIQKLIDNNSRLDIKPREMVNYEILNKYRSLTSKWHTVYELTDNHIIDGYLINTVRYSITNSKFFLILQIISNDKTSFLYYTDTGEYFMPSISDLHLTENDKKLVDKIYIDTFLNHIEANHP